MSSHHKKSFDSKKELAKFLLDEALEPDMKRKEKLKCAAYAGIMANRLWDDYN